MKHLTLTTVAAIVLTIVAGNVLGISVTTFQEVTDNGSGEYQWGESNNWTNGDPSPGNRAEIKFTDKCLIDGETADANQLNVTGTGATLTIDSGSLRVWSTGEGIFRIGKASNGVLYMNGGTITVDSTVAHGGFAVGYSSGGGYIDGNVMQTAGTVNCVNLAIGRNGGTGFYNISGGTLKPTGYINVTATGSTDSNSILTISGTADVNVPDTGYSAGIRVYSGGTVKVVGSNATINIAKNLWMGGWNETDPNTTLSFVADSGGVSTINVDDLVVAADSILDLSSDGNTPDGNYVLVSSTSEVTQADLNNFRFSDTTDTNKWSNLRVDGTYDVKVDYSSGAVTYTLTVNSGTGDGDYEENTKVNIVADAPGPGQSFDVWTGDTANIEDVNLADTNITMPAADAEVTATYVNLLYRLDVNSGTGDGNYNYNDKVNIVADAPGGGQEFDVWTGDTANIEDVNLADTNITMPAANAEVTATYTDIVYRLDVNSGTGDGNYTENTKVNIVADAPGTGQAFDVWTGDTANIEDVNLADTNITMPAADAEVTATYYDIIYRLDVNSGTGDGNYIYNTKVNIVADTPGEGQQFDVWTGDTANIENVNLADTNITMPAANAEVTATYMNILYRLDVNSGTGDGNYEAATKVNIVADSPGTGQAFDVWTGDTTNVEDVNLADTNITMPAANAEVTATYYNIIYRLDVNSGTGDGNYTYNTKVNIVADSPEPNMVFDVWTGDTTNIENVNLADTNITMPAANAEVTATYAAEGNLPAPWQNTDIGNPVPGSANESDGNWTIEGQGQIWGTSDYFHFVYQPYNGDVRITARAIDVDNPSAWATGGVMVRETLEGNCPSAYMACSAKAQGGIVYDYRTIADGNTSETMVAGQEPEWVRLTRVGNTLTGYRSENGTSWIQVDSITISMDANVYVGMGVASSGNNNLCTAVLNNVEVVSLYTLTVNSGTGDGTYPPSEVVNIYADAPGEGQQFDVWTGDTANIADVNEPNTTITMPGSDTNVTATYIDANGLYTLTVNSGTGDGSYEEGTKVNIVADAPGAGQAFDVWTGDTANIEDVNLADTNITMPASDTEITATYEDDPNTFQLTVNSGTGDGYYDANTKVNIVANAPGAGKLFDVWTGDTANIEDVNLSDTNITMPASDAEVTATYEDDPNYEDSNRGYTARACGFDMDDDGTLGGTGDDDVGDGVTTDPDGDGTDEDIIYVDATDGNDSTGDGSANNPYKTVQYALNQADGPGDGAEDIIAIAGVFREELTLTQDGVAGYYTRDSFRFPNNPSMLIGWDKDNDGEYPPYDGNDTAVLDGNSSLAVAIDNPNGRQDLEIAHLTLKDYGLTGAGSRGAMRLRGSGTEQRHIYVHDVELLRICKAQQTDGSYIAFSLFTRGATLRYFACINNLFDEFGSFAFRGGSSPSIGNFRFQNLTMTMFGDPNDNTWRGSPCGWKLWEENDNVEILDCIIDGNPTAYSPTGYVAGIAVCQGSQDWTIRNNELIDCKAGIALQPDAGDPYYRERPVTRIVIDRNIWRNTWTWSMTNSTYAVKLKRSYDPAPATAAVGEVTITNNFFSSTVGFQGIDSDAGNASATPTGTVTIAGNTIYGPTDYGAVYITDNLAYRKEDFVVKNNIIANVDRDYMNISTSYAPTSWVANGNVYDSNNPSFEWNGSNKASLAAWQAATGQDANSTTGEPLFVDANAGDFHLDPNDTVAQGAGVDISSITDHDYDGDTRDANTRTAGADVP